MLSKPELTPSFCQQEDQRDSSRACKQEILTHSKSRWVKGLDIYANRPQTSLRLGDFCEVQGHANQIGGFYEGCLPCSEEMLVNF